MKSKKTAQLIHKANYMVNINQAHEENVVMNVAFRQPIMMIVLTKNK